MLRLLHSLFKGDGDSAISEAVVKLAIERAVDGTDPWLRAVSGYRRKLRPAVLHALEHVKGLVEAFPAPVPVGAGSYADPRLKPFFISREEMRSVFAGDRALQELRRGAPPPPRVHALLAMEKRERSSFGAELSGSIILRDVPQRTVTFENHRLLDPSGEERETRRLLMRRAYDHLLSLALKRLAGVKGERSELERRRALLNAKVNLLQRADFGFERGGGTERLEVSELEERLREVEGQLGELGGEAGMLESYLGVVLDVLRQAEEHLWSTTETIYLDQLGIKRERGGAPELTLAEVRSTAGRTMVALLVSLQPEDFAGTER